MTDMIDAQEERAQDDALESLNIANLRQFSKLLKIESQRDWTKEDFIIAIKQKQASAGIDVVIDGEKAPKPGFSRILIHRDPTPGHKNNPIHLGVNGRILAVPRGLNVDVPTPYVEVLRNAITTKTEQNADPSRDNPAGTYHEVPGTSYPFTVVMTTPGKFHNPMDSRGAQYERKAEFNKKFGRWPTDGELKEAMRQKIVKEL